MHNHISPVQVSSKLLPVEKARPRWCPLLRLGVHLRAPLIDVVVRRDLERLALVDRRLLLHVLVRVEYVDS